MKIEVSLEKGYGRDRFYPENEDAKLICKLVNQKVLTKEQMRIIKEGGWDFEIKLKQYNLDD